MHQGIEKRHQYGSLGPELVGLRLVQQVLSREYLLLQGPVTFREVALYFTDPSQRALYREAMQENYESGSLPGKDLLSIAHDKLLCL